MKRKGFTLIELLTVIAIIALLLSMLSPTIVGFTAMANRLTCAKHMLELTKAYHSYAADNSLNILSSNTNKANQPCWVLGGNALTSLTMGKIWPYVSSSNPGQIGPDSTEIILFKCPTPRSNPEYYRHYSINGKLNGERSVATRLTEIPDPSRTFLFIEEDDYRGYNMNSWFIGDVNRWVDFVSGNHSEGDNLAFVDEHVEWWHWEDPDTLTLPYNDAPFGSPDPGSVDLRRINEVFRPR